MVVIERNIVFTVKIMRVVALVSGGKDSCYNMIQCVREGHTIVALANLHPPQSAKGGHLFIHIWR